MKKLTMVVRCGDIKARAEDSIYTLIDENYNFERMIGTAIVAGISNKTIEVTNLGVTDKGLVATNGALKNYTTFDTTGNMVDKPGAVVLNRVENERGLIGYTIYGLNGTLQEVTVDQLVALAKQGLVANGKIRHTQQGDIVSSINGNYALRVTKMADAAEKTINVDVAFIGSALYGNSNIKYAGLFVNGENAAGVTNIYESLLKANKQLIQDLKDNTGIDESKALGIKRTGSAGFYGAYPIDKAFKIIRRGANKVGLPLNKLMIACTDYDDNKTESTVFLSKDKQIVGKQSGNERTDKQVKVYTEKVLEQFKNIKINK